MPNIRHFFDQAWTKIKFGCIILGQYGLSFKNPTLRFATAERVFMKNFFCCGETDWPSPTVNIKLISL